MAKTVSKLSARSVANAKSPGVYGDGGGLYLQVSNTGTKSWLFRYKVGGRSRYMGLGSLTTISLAKARDLAVECRRLRLQHIDPIDHRNGVRAAARLDAAKAISFDECRDAYLAAHNARSLRTLWESQQPKKLSPSIMAGLSASRIGALAQLMEELDSLSNELPKIGRGRPRADVPMDEREMLEKRLLAGPNPQIFNADWTSPEKASLEFTLP